MLTKLLMVFLNVVFDISNSFVKACTVFLFISVYKILNPNLCSLIECGSGSGYAEFQIVSSHKIVNKYTNFCSCCYLLYIFSNE